MYLPAARVYYPVEVHIYALMRRTSPPSPAPLIHYHERENYYDCKSQASLARVEEIFIPAVGIASPAGLSLCDTK